MVQLSVRAMRSDTRTKQLAGWAAQCLLSIKVLFEAAVLGVFLTAFGLWAFAATETVLLWRLSQ